MRLAVVTLGSAGDLHPYLAIAREMHNRGHEVHLLSQEPHRAAVEAEGVSFQAIASAQDHFRTLTHPGLWHPVGGFGVLWRHLCVPAIVPTFEALSGLCASSGEPLTVFASPLAVGARFLREVAPIRLLTAYTAPSVLRSCSDPMYLGAWRVPGWVPGIARSWLWRALDAWKLEPMAQPKLRPLRDRWKLPPQEGSTFGHWMHSPDGGVALFPRWFAEPSPDWPVQPAFAGFPIFQSDLQPAPDRALLDQFLASGSPPVVVSPGSAAFSAAEFLRVSVDACRSVGRRSVLISEYEHQWPAELGDDILILPSARLDMLLPNCAAVIHHGGIGTSAQAFAAKAPQVIMPSAYDQFENAERVAETGWGLHLAPGRRNSALLAEALSQVLSLAHFATRNPSANDEWPQPSYSQSPNQAVRRACEFISSSRQPNERR